MSNADIYRECRSYRSTIQDLLEALDELNRLGPEHPWSGGATLKLYERALEAKAVLAAWNDVWDAATEKR